MTTKLNDLLIIQFAKWPVLGNVKTRLASSLGDEKALYVHLELMTEVLKKLISMKEEGLKADIALWLNEISDDPRYMEEILTTVQQQNIALKEQKGRNLGDKMANAIADSLARYSRVIIVGSDCPNISVAALRAGSQALKDHSVVMGPAEDGGYVLIGASNFNKEIFKDVNWGKGEVLKKTVNNLKELNISYALLDESWDVDDLADYTRWCAGKNK